MRLPTLWCVASLCVVSAHAAPIVTVDPDAFAVGTILDHAYPGVTLSVVGVPSRSVVRWMGSPPSTAGTSRRLDHWYSALFPLLGPEHPTATVQGWEADLRTLRIDFHTPTDFVSIDFIAADDRGTLSAYDAGGTILATGDNGLIRDAVFTATVSRSLSDIAYAITSGTPQESMMLDNLRVSRLVVPEPDTLALAVTALALIGLGRGGTSRRIPRNPKTSSLGTRGPAHRSKACEEQPCPIEVDRH